METPDSTPECYSWLLTEANRTGLWDNQLNDRQEVKESDKKLETKSAPFQRQ